MRASRGAPSRGAAPRIEHPYNDTRAWESDLHAALSRLYQPLGDPASGIKAITQAMLDESLKLTTSEHGFVSTIDPRTGDSIGHTLTELMPDRCRVAEENWW